jgi:GcrA cell cycle regulator
MAWTDERVELLKKLWMEGLSASQIAAILSEGVTRNAVIGKVHRLKLSGRVKPTSSAPRARKPRATMSRRPSATTPSGVSRRRMVSAPMVGATALKMQPEGAAETAVAPEQVAEIYIEPENRIDLLSLSEQTCKWPIGDPMTDDFYFCGQQPNENKPYCEFHSRRAYHTLDRKRR